MKEKLAGGGIGFWGLLTIVFIVLKLTNIINWSWWIVLSPVLVPLALFGIISLIIVVAVCIIALFSR